MKNEIAILDFFDDETHFSAATVFESKPDMVAMKARVAGLGIKTAIITWLNPTSFHYLPPSLFVETDIEIVNAIEKVLTRSGIKNEKGITWTTDGIYRETLKRTAKRLSQGAIAVEMECAAFAAAAIRCGVRFGQFLFFSDGITTDGWKWMPSSIESQKIKEKLFNVAIEIADEIQDKF